MGGATAGMGADPSRDGAILCRDDARITPLGPDVKGKMNGFAALDIRSHRRYVVVKTAAGFTRLPP